MSTNKYRSNIEKTLNVKINSQGFFTLDDVEFYFFDYEDRNKPTEFHLGARGHSFIKFKGEDLDELLASLKKKWPKLKERVRKKLEKQADNESNDTQIYTAIQNAKHERDIHFDGQNIMIRTGKDPILVEMLMNLLDSYDRDPNYKMLYK